MDTNIHNTMTANTGDNTDCRNGSKRSPGDIKLMLRHGPCNFSSEAPVNNTNVNR